MAPLFRQQRLSGFEPASQANYHVIRKPLLSASTLAYWFICNTKPFIQRVLEAFGIEVTNAAMRRGAEAHAAVQGALEATTTETDLTFPVALARKEFLMGTETHLIDERRRLHGFVDVIYAQEGRLHILELKNSRPPRRPHPLWGATIWPDHAVQLHLYGILGRSEFGVTPQLGLSYLKDGAKEAVLDELVRGRDPQAGLARLTAASVPLAHTPDARRRILEEVKRFRRAERALEVPLPDHDDPLVCATCSVRGWCPRRLDRPGEFAALDAGSLASRG